MYATYPLVLVLVVVEEGASMRDNPGHPEGEFDREAWNPAPPTKAVDAGVRLPQGTMGTNPSVQLAGAVRGALASASAPGLASTLSV